MIAITCAIVFLNVFFFSFYGLGIDLFPSISLAVVTSYFYEAVSR